MKRLLAACAVALIAMPQASAAPKSVAVQLGSIYSAPTNTEGFVLSGKNSIFYANLNVASSDIQVTAIDPSGNQIWQRTIDSGVDEIATAATVDPQGNIWLAGSAALPAANETTTPVIGIDNPDLVSVEAGTVLRTDMNLLALWKISSAGELLATYLSPQKSIPVINALSATNSGISIIGALEAKPFLITATTSGTFGKTLVIGSSKSEFNAVARNSDGSTSIFGSSSEKLAGKNLAGIRDGVLLKISKSGAVTSIVRSSAQKASRSWISGDTSHLVSGPVITGKVTETAITKFTSTFSPTWTLRLPSVGASTTLSANGNSYLAFTSRGPITGISSWKPTQPSLLVITFDSKGVMKAATALPGLVTPLLLQYSASRGVVGLATASDGTVSIFTLVSR
ncbi:hypothetical protein MCEMRE196_01323 [Candidatus Nanopelagicaceae bacterium]